MFLIWWRNVGILFIGTGWSRCYPKTQKKLVKPVLPQ